MNTWSTTSDEYKDIFVSCLCPHRIRMQNISDELQSEGVGARNANYGNHLLIISIKTLQKFCSTEFRIFPANIYKEYIVSISIRKEFNMLIHTLKIFGVSFNYYFIIIIDSFSTGSQHQRGRIRRRLF